MNHKLLQNYIDYDKKLEEHKTEANSTEPYSFSDKDVGWSAHTPYPDIISQAIHQSTTPFRCGFCETIDRVWVTVDNHLFLWDPEKRHTMHFDGIDKRITCVCCVPLSQELQHLPLISLLLVCSTSDIFLLGIQHNNHTQPQFGTKNSPNYTTDITLVQLNLHTSCFSIMQTAIAADDRIFLCDTEGDLYELLYDLEGNPGSGLKTQSHFFSIRNTITGIDYSGSCSLFNHSKAGIFSQLGSWIGGLTSILSPAIGMVYSQFTTQMPSENENMIIDLAWDSSRHLLYTLQKCSIIAFQTNGGKGILARAVQFKTEDTQISFAGQNVSFLSIAPISKVEYPVTEVESSSICLVAFDSNATRHYFSLNSSAGTLDLLTSRRPPSKNFESNRANVSVVQYSMGIWIWAQRAEMSGITNMQYQSTTRKSESTIKKNEQTIFFIIGDKCKPVNPLDLVQDKYCESFSTKSVDNEQILGVSELNSDNIESTTFNKYATFGFVGGTSTKNSMNVNPPAHSGLSSHILASLTQEHCTNPPERIYGVSSNMLPLINIGFNSPPRDQRRLLNPFTLIHPRSVNPLLIQQVVEPRRFRILTTRGVFHATLRSPVDRLGLEMREVLERFHDIQKREPQKRASLFPQSATPLLRRSSLLLSRTNTDRTDFRENSHEQSLSLKNKSTDSLEKVQTLLHQPEIMRTMSTIFMQTAQRIGSIEVSAMLTALACGHAHGLGESFVSPALQYPKSSKVPPLKQKIHFLDTNIGGTHVESVDNISIFIAAFAETALLGPRNRRIVGTAVDTDEQHLNHCMQYQSWLLQECSLNSGVGFNYQILSPNAQCSAMSLHALSGVMLYLSRLVRPIWNFSIMAPITLPQSTETSWKAIPDLITKHIRGSDSIVPQLFDLRFSAHEYGFIRYRVSKLGEWLSLRLGHMMICERDVPEWLREHLMQMVQDEKLPFSLLVTRSHQAKEKIKVGTHGSAAHEEKEEKYNTPSGQTRILRMMTMMRSLNELHSGRIVAILVELTEKSTQALSLLEICDRCQSLMHSQQAWWNNKLVENQSRESYFSSFFPKNQSKGQAEEKENVWKVMDATSAIEDENQSRVSQFFKNSQQTNSYDNPENSNIPHFSAIQWYSFQEEDEPFSQICDFSPSTTSVFDSRGLQVALNKLRKYFCALARPEILKNMTFHDLVANHHGLQVGRALAMCVLFNMVDCIVACASTTLSLELSNKLHDFGSELTNNANQLDTQDIPHSYFQDALQQLEQACCTLQQYSSDFFSSKDRDILVGWAILASLNKVMENRRDKNERNQYISVRNPTHMFSKSTNQGYELSHDWGNEDKEQVEENEKTEIGEANKIGRLGVAQDHVAGFGDLWNMNDIHLLQKAQNHIKQACIHSNMLAVHCIFGLLVQAEAFSSAVAIAIMWIAKLREENQDISGDDTNRATAKNKETYSEDVITGHASHSSYQIDLILQLLFGMMDELLVRGKSQVVGLQTSPTSKKSAVQTDTPFSLQLRKIIDDIISYQDYELQTLLFKWLLKNGMRQSLVTLKSPFVEKYLESENAELDLLAERYLQRGNLAAGALALAHKACTQHSNSGDTNSFSLTLSERFKLLQEAWEITCRTGTDIPNRDKLSLLEKELRDRIEVAEMQQIIQNQMEKLHDMLLSLSFFKTKDTLEAQLFSDYRSIQSFLSLIDELVNQIQNLGLNEESVLSRALVLASAAGLIMSNIRPSLDTMGGYEDNVSQLDYKQLDMVLGNSLDACLEECRNAMTSLDTQLMNMDQMYLLCTNMHLRELCFELLKMSEVESKEALQQIWKGIQQDCIALYSVVYASNTLCQSIQSEFEPEFNHEKPLQSIAHKVWLLAYACVVDLAARVNNLESPENVCTTIIVSHVRSIHTWLCQQQDRELDELGDFASSGFGVRSIESSTVALYQQCLDGNELLVPENVINCLIDCGLTFPEIYRQHFILLQSSTVKRTLRRSFELIYSCCVIIFQWSQIAVFARNSLYSPAIHVSEAKSVEADSQNTTNILAHQEMDLETLRFFIPDLIKLCDTLLSELHSLDVEIDAQLLFRYCLRMGNLYTKLVEANTKATSQILSVPQVVECMFFAINNSRSIFESIIGL